MIVKKYEFYNILPKNSPRMSLQIPSGVAELPDFFGVDCFIVTSEGADGLSYIGPNVFRGNTNMTSVDLSGCSSLTSLGSMALSECSKLSDIILPPSLETMGVGSIANCTSLVSLDLSFCERIKLITPFFCNMNFSLIDIRFPLNIQTIGTCAIGNCTSLVYLDLSAYLQLEKLENHAFSNALSLQDIVFPPNIQKISTAAFKNCTSLIRLNLGNCHQLLKIDAYAFSQCNSLCDIILPPNIDVIDIDAFESCTRLVSIRIPAFVREVKMHAFYGCTQLAEVIFEGDTKVNATSFANCPKLVRRMYPSKRHSGLRYGKYSELKGRLRFGQGEPGESATCGISLEEFADDLDIVVLQCGHAFCEEALHTWIERQKICPACKNAIQ
jgi:hypothetical protein